MIVELEDGREFRLPDDSEETKVDELVKALLSAESKAASALATAQTLQAEVAALRAQCEKQMPMFDSTEIVAAVKEGANRTVKALLADTVLVRDETTGEHTRSKKVMKGA